MHSIEWSSRLSRVKNELHLSSAEETPFCKPVFNATWFPTDNVQSTDSALHGRFFTDRDEQWAWRDMQYRVRFSSDCLWTWSILNESQLCRSNQATDSISILAWGKFTSPAGSPTNFLSVFFSQHLSDYEFLKWANWWNHHQSQMEEGNLPAYSSHAFGAATLNGQKDSCVWTLKLFALSLMQSRGMNTRTKHQWMFLDDFFPFCQVPFESWLEGGDLDRERNISLPFSFQKVTFLSDLASYWNTNCLEVLTSDNRTFSAVRMLLIFVGLGFVLPIRTMIWTKCYFRFTHWTTSHCMSRTSVYMVDVKTEREKLFRSFPNERRSFLECRGNNRLISRLKQMSPVSGIKSSVVGWGWNLVFFKVKKCFEPLFIRKEGASTHFPEGKFVRHVQRIFECKASHGKERTDWTPFIATAIIRFPITFKSRKHINCKNETGEETLS